MRFITPLENLTRLNIGFSHLKENKFGHDFEDCIDPICNSGDGYKTTNQFFLHCANFDGQRQTLFNKSTSIDNANLSENKNLTVYIVINKTE